MQNRFRNEYQALKNTHLEQQKRLLEIQSTGVYTNEQKQTQQRALLTKQQREYQDLISEQKRQFKVVVNFGLLLFSFLMVIISLKNC